MTRYLLLSGLVFVALIIQNIECRLDAGIKKEGACPKIENKNETLECATSELEEEAECLLDFDCPVDRKCCSDGCKFACVNPVRNITAKEETKITSCGELPSPPENARYTTNPKGQVKILCIEGFYREGYPLLKCVNGTWKKTEVQCFKKACGAPGRPENGEVSGTNYQVGAVVSYKCSSECFTLKGEEERTCLPNETWSGELPSCKRLECPELLKGWDLKNGYVFGQDFKCGSEIRFQCNDGYELIGRSVSTCGNDSQWSAELPYCKNSFTEIGEVVEEAEEETEEIPPSVMCKEPKYPSNGYIRNGRIEDFYEEGFVLKFGCFVQHEMVGPSTITCQWDGSWSSSPPTCKKIGEVLEELEEETEEEAPSVMCKEPKYPSNGYIRNGRMEDFYEEGFVLKFGCLVQHEMVGPSTITCQKDGSWSSSSPTCKISFCDDIEAHAAKGGSRAGSNLIGRKMRYFCAQHSTLVGPKEITCQDNGKWSEKPPICKPLCDEVKCDKERKCIFDSNLHQPRCVCKEIDDCKSLYQPICASDGTTYNNECLMQSKSCKTQKKITKVSEGTCLPGGVCAIKPTSYCRGYFDVFYYNPEIKACQELVVGGCHKSGWNGFDSIEECNDTCITSTSGPLCSRPPSPGPCKNFRMNWYHDAKENKCKQFQYGGCFGNQNNFASEEDCMKVCPQVSTIKKTEITTKPQVCKIAADLCKRHKTSNYTITGKVMSDGPRSLLVKLTGVFKDTGRLISEKQVKLFKMPVATESSVSSCALELPSGGELVFSGGYYMTDDEGEPLMMIQEGDYIGKYYSPKQLACTKY